MLNCANAGPTPGGAVSGSGGEGLAAWRAKRRKKLGDGSGGGSGTCDGGDIPGGATDLNPPRDPQVSKMATLNPKAWPP